jgi:6-phosphofructokinase
MMTKQRIGFLTSGGDCSGLDAALRPVAHRAVMGYDWNVVHIENGTLGSLQRPVGARLLTPADS